MTNQKSLILALTALALGNSAMASASGGFYKSGIYAGVAVGASFMNTSIKETLFVPAPASVDENKSGADRSFESVADVFIGCRYFFENRFFAGLEFATSWDSNETTQKFNLDGINVSTKLESSLKFAPLVVMGKQFSDKWLGFIKFGPTFANFRGNHSRSFGTATPVVETFKIKKTGFLGAVGAEYAFNQHVSTVGSIAYEYYGNIRQSIKLDLGGAGEKNEINVKPSYITAKLGLMYRF